MCSSPTMAISKGDEYLPEELMIDILYRLPVKSIGRCRCVSKQWHNFLSDPKFIKLHFNRTKEEKLILVSGDCELHTITFNHQNGEIGSISRKLNFQQISYNCVSVAGSCNGLVLVVDSKNVHFLMNPTTLKYHKFPIFPLQGRYYYTCGLGYDVVSDDYKVVALSYPRSNVTVTCVDIYSVRKGLWEKLENSPYDHSHTDPAASGVLVNGALHWCAHKIPEHSFTIAAFDLSVKFSDVPGPTVLGSNGFSCNLVLCNLATLKGCLCISTGISPHKGIITFWIMKEYGVEESWTEFEIKDLNLNIYFSTLLCSIGDDDDVLLEVNEKLAVYNMKENQRRDHMIDVTYFRYEVQTFMDSLVFPSFDNETEG